VVQAERLAVHRKSEQTDASRMVNDTERSVFSFLQDRLSTRMPGAQLYYESTTFSFQGDDGTVSSTVPDIHIVKPNGSEIFIEITNGNKNKKKREVDIMGNFPQVRYVVWGRVELKHVQKTIRRKSPHYTLLHRRKQQKRHSVIQSSK